MKIGILTFHRPINYGAFLQSFALSDYLKKIFPNEEFEIVDYIAPKENKNIFLNILRTVKWYGVSSGIKEIRKIEVFKNALQYLPRSEKYFCTGDLNKIYSYIDSKYDMLIIGSDAVFNWNQNGFPSAFIPEYSFKIPVVTNEALTPIHCCDPTVIMDYQSLYSIKHRSLTEISKKYNIDLSKQYIVMMLEDQEIAKEVYERYSKIYTVVSLFKKNKYSDKFLYDLTPVEWALVLKCAKVAVTNYFHGTLVSLGQGTPTIVVDLSNYDEPYEGKLDDLVCHRLELPELYVKKADWILNKKEIFETMDLCLDGKFNSRINNAMNIESKTFERFHEYLKKIFYIKKTSYEKSSIN